MTKYSISDLFKLIHEVFTMSLRIYLKYKVSYITGQTGVGDIFIVIKQARLCTGTIFVKS